MWPLVPAILLCKRGGNVTVGPTVERLANHPNVWGKSIRKGRVCWADPLRFPFFQPSTVPTRALVSSYSRSVLLLVWSGSWQPVWTSNQTNTAHCLTLRRQAL